MSVSIITVCLSVSMRTSNSVSQDCTHRDDHNLRTSDMTPGLKPFTVLLLLIGSKWIKMEKYQKKTKKKTKSFKAFAEEKGRAQRNKTKIYCRVVRN